MDFRHHTDFMLADSSLVATGLVSPPVSIGLRSLSASQGGLFFVEPDTFVFGIREIFADFMVLSAGIRLRMFCFCENCR